MIFVKLGGLLSSGDIVELEAFRDLRGDPDLGVLGLFKELSPKGKLRLACLKLTAN